MAAPFPETTLATPVPPPLPSLVNSRRLRAQRLGRALRLWVPAGVLILLLAVCFLLPLVVTLPSSTNGNIIVNNEPPFSPGHWLGTNVQGVDIFSQLVYGGQVAIEISLSVTVLSMAIGCTLGIVAAYFGGWVDAVISRLLDILLAFPVLVLALVIAEGLGPSESHVIAALLAFGIPAFGRVARGATLTIRGLPYMTAARLCGTRAWRIIARHIVQPAGHRRCDHPGGRAGLPRLRYPGPRGELGLHDRVRPAGADGPAGVRADSVDRLAHHRDCAEHARRRAA
jgi:ABC-type dipeptide/oligopeptide/nickel transport system permease subunit